MPTDIRGSRCAAIQLFSGPEGAAVAIFGGERVHPPGSLHRLPQRATIDSLFVVPIFPVLPEDIAAAAAAAVCDAAAFKAIQQHTKSGQDAPSALAAARTTIEQLLCVTLPPNGPGLSAKAVLPGVRWADLALAVVAKQIPPSSELEQECWNLLNPIFSPHLGACS
jgi:hypothetical protein